MVEVAGWVKEGWHCNQGWCPVPINRRPSVNDKSMNFQPVRQKQHLQNLDAEWDK
jgi:hypothetical protein